MALQNSQQPRIDPLRGYNFIVSIVDSSSILAAALSAIQPAAVAGFSECSGLETTLDVEEYKEGGNNGTVLRFPTRVTWAHLRLRRGVALSDDLFNWHHDFVLGFGKRRDGVVILQDDQHNPVKVWTFTRGLPVKYTGPSLNATQSQVAIEEMEIAHEGLQLQSFGRPAVFGAGVSRWTSKFKT
jgi:phage tail-like protein